MVSVGLKGRAVLNGKRPGTKAEPSEPLKPARLEVLSRPVFSPPKPGPTQSNRMATVEISTNFTCPGAPPHSISAVLAGASSHPVFATPGRQLLLVNQR
jgi:hypothetical protein